MLNALAEGVLVLQKDAIAYCNRQLIQMLGYSDNLEGFWGKSLDQLVHPEDLEMVRENHIRRMAGETAPTNYRIRVVKADGEERIFSCRASLSDWHGEPATIGCVFDITEQVAREVAKTRSAEMFRNVFQMAPEVMLLINNNTGRIIDVNPAYLNIFGARRDAVIRKKATDLSIWSDQTVLDRLLEELKISTSITDMPVVLTTRGGIVRHFRLFAQTIEDPRTPLLLIAGRDVTEDMSREAELQRSRDTAELANRTKSEFLANMSHELRTPLNAILGFAEIIRNEIFGPVGVDKYKEYSGDIHNSGSHLLSIINDILDLSKVEAGKLEAHLAWINPAASMEMCLNVVAQRAHEAEIELHQDIDNDILLEADERLVRQICINLLTNAVKFTPPKGKVFLSLGLLMSGDLCLTVRDTGIGMTPAEIKIAKRPFGQVQTSSNRGHEGSGLGLPLVSAFFRETAC